MEKRIRFELLDYQDKFLFCTATHRAFFSEFQSGKTAAASMDLIMNCQKQKIQAAVIRNINYDLISSTIPNLKDLYDWDLTGESFNKTHKILELENGSQILFIGLDRPDDVRKLKNIRLGYVLIDQAEEIAQEVFDMASGRLSQEPGKSVCVGNFEGRDWYWYKFFQKPLEKGSGIFKGKKRDYGVFQGETEDFIGFWPPPFENEKNIKPGYYDDLIRTHSTDWVDKYVFGIPTGNAGLLHKDFDDTRHKVGGGDYREFPNSPGYIRYQGMDYGIASPTAWLFAVHETETDIIYIIDEYYEANESIYVHGPQIKQMMKTYGNPSWIAGCPRTFQTEKDGKTPADEYRSSFQIHIEPYPIGIEPRVEIVNRRFKQGKIKIYDRCKHLIRQIEGASWKNIEKNFEDHALEAFHRLVSKIDRLNSIRMDIPDDSRKEKSRRSMEFAGFMGKDL